MILRELGETRLAFLHATVYADFLYADFFPKRQNGCARSKPNKNLKTENDMSNNEGELLRIHGYQKRVRALRIVGALHRGA